jgi:tetratricopeptide (TPR) repeat protein
MALAIVLNRRRQVPAEDSPAFGAIAERFRRAGDLERAVNLCQEGLQKYPKHLSSRVTLGWALLDLGRYDEARAELEQVLKRAPDNLAAIRGLAELHDRTEHDDVASMQTGPSRWATPEEELTPVDGELPDYSSPKMTAEESLDAETGPWIGLQGEAEPALPVPFPQVASAREATEPHRPIFANEISEVDALAAELLDVDAQTIEPAAAAFEVVADEAPILELVPPSQAGTDDGFIPDEGPGPWPPVFEDEVATAPDHQVLRLAHGSAERGDIWPPLDPRQPVRRAPVAAPAEATAGSEFSTALAQPPQAGLLSALGRFRRRVDARRRAVVSEYVAG